ncbi:MAG: TonB-dependent receptor [Mangrovibacterium sp.]|nr:TonB-dependent receptor [Mangrovibacterium sp.]
MKLTFLLILVSMFSVFANKTYSQSKMLNLHMEKATVRDVLSEIEDQSQFNFMYSSEIIDVNRLVSINIQDAKIDEVLKSLFAGTDVSYTIRDRLVVLNLPEYRDASRVQQQTLKISGRVADSSGSPLPGVSVVVKGSTTGTVTDFDGKYTLANVPGNATLVFSFVGMRAQEVVVGSKSVIDISMEEETIGIEEVVAIGYGTVRKADLTGSVATVSTKDFDKVPSSNPLQVLQGRATGLQITTNSGLPGDGASVLVRGVKSINGSTSPIYVVDGMITDNINNINPGSIESVSVLKDASASAIYGARASNGVILVTTKRGEGKKDVEISLNAYYGVQTESNLKLKLLNASQYLELMTEAFQNSSIDLPWTQADLVRYEGVDTNWKDLITQTGIIQSYDLSVTGGSEKSNYYVSAGYLDQKGMVIGTGYKKYTLNFNSDHKISNWIKFGNSLNLYSAKREGDGIQYANALRKSPLVRAYEDNGDYGIIHNTTLEHQHINPIWGAKEVVHNTVYEGVQGNLYLTLKLLEGLEFTARGSMDYSNEYTTDFTPGIAPYYVWEGSAINSISKYYEKAIHWIGDFLLNYNKTINDHEIKVLLGYSLEENVYEFLEGSRTGTPSNAIQFLRAGDPTSQLNDNGFTDWSFGSLFSRLNYTYKNKYLFTGTIRRDGTSRLSKGNRYGIFPSASVAWRVSEEGFIKNADFVDDLKLRVSYGTLGNILSIDPYGTIATLSDKKSVIDQAPAKGYTLTDAVNSALKWESSAKKNVAIDFTGLGNRLYSTIEYFIEDISNLLFNEPIAWSTGLSGTPMINAGKIRNRGYELELGYRGKKSDWTYDVSFNLSHVKNEVVDLEGRDLRTSGLVEGYPARSFFGYKSNGIIRSENQLDIYQTGQFTTKGIGDIALLDIDGRGSDGKLTGEPDGKVDADDRTIIGKRYPDFTYGALGTVSYKNWGLQVQLQGVQGIDMTSQPNGAFSLVQLMSGLPRNEDARVLNRYHPTKNPNGTWPKLSKNNSGSNDEMSEFWLEDMSYLRIKNVNFSYNLPQRLCAKLKLRQLNLYSSIQNVFTFSKYKGSEADVTYRSDGVEKSTPSGQLGVPQPRTWTVGFKATF